MTDVTFHPTEKNIITSRDEDDSLLMSKDYGQSWEKVKNNVKEFTFAKFSDNSYFVNKNRIFSIVEDLDNKNRLTQKLVFTDNFFNKTHTILEDVEFFKLTKCCIYVKEKDGEMKIADAFGLFYHFYNLTIEGLDENSFSEFNIIDNDQFFNTFGSMSYNYKNYELNRLMKSDYFGSKFKILLDDLVCERKLGFCDFIPVKSLPGVILVNRYEKSYIEAT